MNQYDDAIMATLLWRRHNAARPHYDVELDILELMKGL